MSVNKVILIGRLARDVEARNMPNGNTVVNMTVVTSERWKDKNTGERKEKAEFHRVVIFGDGLTRVAQAYLQKGSQVYIEGQLQTRSWEQDGQKRYATEIVLQGFNGKLSMLDSPAKSEDDSSTFEQDELDDEIPF